MKDGDKIEWKYTCDLGADVGNPYLNNRQEKQVKKIRRDAFADSHPIVNLIYFIFVIGFAMMSLHPVSLGIAFGERSHILSA